MMIIRDSTESFDYGDWSITITGHDYHGFRWTVYRKGTREQVGRGLKERISWAREAAMAYADARREDHP